MTKSSASRSRTAGASLFNSARFHRFSIAMTFDESCAAARNGTINHGHIAIMMIRARFMRTPEVLAKSEYIGEGVSFGRSAVPLMKWGVSEGQGCAIGSPRGKFDCEVWQVLRTV